jgi:hypothetical protein
VASLPPPFLLRPRFSQGIEFRDYLREKDVMSTPIDVMMSDPDFRRDWDQAAFAIADMHRKDKHLRLFTDDIELIFRPGS